MAGAGEPVEAVISLMTVGEECPVWSTEHEEVWYWLFCRDEEASESEAGGEATFDLVYLVIDGLGAYAGWLP